MSKQPSPLTVWLIDTNRGAICRVVRPDESSYEVDTESKSLLGAQQEITGFLISQGYWPADDWAYATQGECSRAFVFKGK